MPRKHFCSSLRESKEHVTFGTGGIVTLCLNYINRLGRRGPCPSHPPARSKVPVPIHGPQAEEGGKRSTEKMLKKKPCHDAGSASA